MKDSLHTIIFALVLGVVCALLLTGAGEFTKKYREANEKAEWVRNILKVLEIPVPEDASTQDMLNLFKENIREVNIGKMSVYKYCKAGDESRILGYAVPFEGPGLWGDIHGLLALESDLETIRGISFYKQEETPGLGGEIASDDFQKQFKNKKIGGGRLRIRGGTDFADNEVEAITGATMTCGKVEAMLNSLVERILKESGKNAE